MTFPLAALSGPLAPFGRVAQRRKESGRPELQPLSVFIDAGVVPRSEREDNHNQLGADLGQYLVVEPGDIVFNKLRTWQGGLGVSRHHGIVSPAYFVCRPSSEMEPRFLHYVLRSAPYRAELTRISKFMPPSQFDVLWEDLRSVPVPLLPLAGQRAIADFLDTETARIDALIARKGETIKLLAERDVALAFAAITGTRAGLSRRPSGVDWIGSIPSHWPIASVSSQFDVQLGRMLNPERVSGPHLRPYIRNFNVRWDTVDLSDIAEMDFPPADQARYRLQTGDLVINEGGAGIGRTAIWQGGMSECYFSKSVLRLRSSGWTDPRWMIECMRAAVAMNVFAVEGNLATIPHVPAEALRMKRFPFPPRGEQQRQLDWVSKQRQPTAHAQTRLHRQIELLHEHRQALITSVVTGGS